MENVQDGNLNNSRSIPDNYVFLEIYDEKEKNQNPKSDFKIIEDLNDIHEIKVFGQNKNKNQTIPNKILKSTNNLKTRNQKNSSENYYSNYNFYSYDNEQNEFLQNKNVDGNNEFYNEEFLNNGNEEKNLGKKLSEEDLNLLIESLCHELFHCQEVDYLSQSKINIIFKIMNDEDKNYVINGIRAQISNEIEANIFNNFVNSLY